MTSTSDSMPEPNAKRSRKPVIVGLALAVLGGAAGFAIVASGLFGGPSSTTCTTSDQAAGATALPLNVAFVPLDPLVISLPATNGRNHLRFTAQLEVPLTHQAEVAAIKPRIIDVLNGYLRAVDVAELEDPAALVRMRSQMLRRVQVVAGDGRINDLLVMEFVLN